MRRGDGLRKWADFSQIGVEMIVVIVGFTYAGKFLQEKYKDLAPYILAGMSLFGVFLSIYIVIKRVRQMKDDDK